jgi:hypothetical protein
MFFIVHTATGPDVHVAANSIEEAMGYVEDRVPLKRSWVGRWHHEDDLWTYTRFNSRGRVKGCIQISVTSKKETVK